MSWLSEIAGKAEALLDRMDQAAATSIQSTGLATPQTRTALVGRETHETALTYEPTASVGVEKTPSLPPNPPSTSLPPHKHVATYSPVAHPEPPPKTTPTPSSFSKSRSSVPSDDSIFEFLNTPTRTEAKKPHLPKNLNKRNLSTVSSHNINRSDSLGEGQPLSGVEEEKRGHEEGDKHEGVEGEGRMRDGEREKREKDVPKKSQVVDDTDSGGGGNGSPVPPQAVGSGEVPVDPLESGRLSVDSGKSEVIVQHQPTLGEVEKAVGPGSSDPSEQKVASLQKKVSDLELENKLLKREVSSLNDELETVLERVREAEESVALHRRDTESLREQVTASDHVIRQLRSHDEDIQTTLQARETQIQVLKRELQESEKRESVLKEQLVGQGREKERLLQDASLSSEASSHALEGLKTQLQQAEEQLSQEREAATRAKVDFVERESILQNEQQQLTDSLAAQHRQLGLLQSKVAESQRAVQSANRELAQTRKEFEDYKKRAAGILQTKEKLISSLQAGSDGASGPAQEAAQEQFQLEKEAIEMELETARLQGVQLREELQETEEQHSQEMEQLTEQVNELESRLMAERTQQQSVKEDLQRVTVELEASREAWERERHSLEVLVKERETEIASLKTKVLGSPLSPHSHSEMESRLHELTENLIQKQTTLEALGSEKTALKLQLERTESQLLDARRARPPPPHTAVNGLDTTDTAIRPMISMLPTTDSTYPDSRLHNVRRAMNTFDTLSVRLAVFLRRYPYARLFLLIYVALLHLWVLVVLLTYTPEIHDLADLDPTQNTRL